MNWKKLIASVVISLVIGVLCAPAQAAMTTSVLSPVEATADWWGGGYGDTGLKWMREVQTIIELWGLEGDVSFDDILFVPTDTPPTVGEGRLYFNDSANALRLYANGSWVTLASSAGNSLDSAYNAGSTIDVDAGAVTFTAGNDDDNIVFAIVQADTGATVGMTITSAGTGALLSFDSNGTGLDISGSDANYTISKAGIGTFAGLIVGGTDIVMENGDTFDNASDDVFAFTSNDLEDFKIDLTGTNIVKFTSGSSAVTLEFDTLDAFTGVGSIAFDADDAVITLAADGTDDLTLSVTGVQDTRLLLQSSGTEEDAIALSTSAGGMTFTVAGAAGAEDLTLASNTAVNITSSQAADLAINIATSNAAGQIIITSADTTADGIDVDSAGGIDVDAVDTVTIDTSGAGKDIRLDAALGSVYIEGLEASASAISLNATDAAGGITVDFGTGNMVVAGTGVSADLTIDVDLLSIDATGASNISVTGGAGEDLTISQLGAADASVIVSSTGTAEAAATEADAAIQLVTATGGIGIRSAVTGGVADAIRLETDGGVSDGIIIHSNQGTGTTEGSASIQLLSDVGSIELKSGMDAADAINIMVDSSTAGGILIFNDTGTSVTEDTASIQLLSDAGGICIQSDSNLDDALVLRVAGGTTAEMTLHNDTGNTADSIELISDAGGIVLVVPTGKLVTMAATAGAGVTMGNTTATLTVLGSTITFSEDDLTNVGNIACDNITADSDVDVYLSTFKTVIKTINLVPGGSTDDFNAVASAGTHEEQFLDLGELIPAFAQITTIQIRCFESISAGTISFDIGVTTGAGDVLSAKTIGTAGNVAGSAAAGSPIVIGTTAARHIWFNVDPSEDWDNLTTGRYAVMVTYADYGAVFTNDGP